MASIDDFLAWGTPSEEEVAPVAAAAEPAAAQPVAAPAPAEMATSSFQVKVDVTPDVAVAKAINESTDATASTTTTTSTPAPPAEDDEDSDVLRSLQQRHHTPASRHPHGHHAQYHNHERDSLSVPSAGEGVSLLDYQPLTASEQADELNHILQEYHRTAAASASHSAFDRAIGAAIASVKELQAQLQTEIANERAFVEAQLKQYNDLRVASEKKLHEIRDLIAQLHTARTEKTAEVESLRARVAKAEDESVKIADEVEAVKRSLREVKQRQTRRQQQQSKKKVALFPFLANVSNAGSGDAAVAAVAAPADDGSAEGRGVALPAAAINSIFHFLLVREVATCTHVCRSWQQAIEKNRVWLTLLERVTVQNRREKQRKLDELAALGYAQRGEFVRDSWSDLGDLAANARTEQADEYDDDVDDTPSASGASGSGANGASGSSGSGGGGLFSRLRKKNDSNASATTPSNAASSTTASSASGSGASPASPSSSANPALDSIDPRAPCPPHSHFALTIEMGPKDLYNVAVQSRVMRLERECQGMRDSIDGGRTKAGMVAEKDKRRITVIVCELEPKQLTAELSFCQTTCSMHQTMSVAQADLKRLLEQMDADEQIKQQLRRELTEAKQQASNVETEHNTLQQQYSSDEVTKGFLADAFAELETKCIDEEEQTLQLEEAQRRELQAKEEELRGIQSEQERQQKQIGELREIKALLTKEVKNLQGELEQATQVRDERRAQLDRMQVLLQELAAV